MHYSIVQLKAGDLGPLRHLVLWPHKSTAEECVMLEDEWDGTQHWGVVQSEGPVLVCSTWIDQQAPEFPGLTMKRLRAMGTHPDFQQRGLGAQLIQHVEQLLRQTHDGMWCDAREVAVPFYEKCGWTIIHGPYEVPLIGTHFKMAKTWKGDKSSL